MKKPLKAFIITIIIVGLIAGAIAIAYFVNRNSKTAKVVALDWYAMTSYYGDELNSSGTVMSDESQVIYLGKEDKVASVSVNVGDQVKKGDLLFTLEVKPQDITGKELAIRSKEIALRRLYNELNILLRKEPVPDAKKVKIENVTKTIYRNVFTCTSKVGIDFNNDDVLDIKEGENIIVKVEYYDSDANQTLIKTEYYPGLKEEEYEQLVTAGKLDGMTSTLDTKGEMLSDVVVVEQKYIDEDGELLGSKKYDVFGEILGNYDLPVGLTAKELSNQIAKLQYQINTSELSIRKDRNELETLKKMDNDGKVLATMDGVVTKLQDYNNIASNAAFLTVAASDEYFVRGSIGEFDLDTVHVGDTCFVNNWQRGSSSEATIISIDDFADEGGSYWSSGNNNVSSYGFRAVLSNIQSCDIGDYVDITISQAQESEQGFYIEKSLVRKDPSGNYVMIMDENSCLKKVYVSCGKTVWGSYVQILGGDISIDDYIAFPYGDGAIEGAKCEIVDSLYSY